MNKKLRNVAFVLVPILMLTIAAKSFEIEGCLTPESESVSGSFFLMQGKNIKNGYVVFEYDKPEYKNYKHGKLFIKKIGCNSGQYLVVADKKAICDGKVIATMLEFNAEGARLPIYEYNGVIAENKFFALGEHSRSFDSRYFGLVDKDSIKYTARKVF